MLPVVSSTMTHTLLYWTVLLLQTLLTSGQTSKGVGCPQEFLMCSAPNTRTVVPSSYTIPQGFTRPKANRSYGDHLYTTEYNRPFIQFWKSNMTAMVWLQNGTGQLVDGKCGSDFFRDTEAQYPWIGWNTNYTPRTLKLTSVRLFFYFSKLTAITNIRLHILNARDSGVAIFDVAVAFISNDTASDVIADVSEEKNPYQSGSGWKLGGRSIAGSPLNSDKGAVVKQIQMTDVRPGRVLQLLLISQRQSNFSWILLSEVHFCERHVSTATLTPSSPVTSSSTTSTVQQQTATGSPSITTSSTTFTTTAASMTASPTSTMAMTSVTPAVMHKSPQPEMTFPTSLPDVFDLVDGEPGTIMCQVRNAARLELIKEGETEVLANASGVNMQSSLISLSWDIHTVQREQHAGRYRCKAVHTDGQQLTHHLMVNIKPAFEVIPVKPKKVPIGSMVLLQCCLEDNRLSGRKNKPQWVWTHINGPFRTSVDTKEASYLFLANVSTKDAGRYFCQVSAHSQRSHTAMLSLEVQDDKSVDPLTVHQLQLQACGATLPEPETLPATEGTEGPRKDRTSSSDSMSTVTAVALMVALLIVILVLALILLYVVRRRVNQRKSSYVYSVEELTSPQPIKINQKYLPVSQVQTVDSAGYQMVPGDDCCSSSPVQAVAPPYPSNTPDIVFTSSSGSSSASSASNNQSSDGRKRFPIYAEVSVGKVKEKFSPDMNTNQDGGPYAEASVKQRISSVSSDLPPPALPKRLPSVSSVSTTDTRELPAQEFNLYDDPADCQQKEEGHPTQNEVTKIYEEPSIKPECMLMTDVAGKSLKPLNAIYEEPPPLTREDGPPEIDSLQLDRQKKIGEGQFGDVFLAMMYFRTGENSHLHPPQAVALKVLKASAGKELVEAFKKEVKFMSRLRHPNVIRLLGVCSKGQPCMVIEHMENRDLNTYLNRCKLLINATQRQSTADNHFMTFQELLHMAQQVASGMEYMSQHGFVHRDLAARNCLVDGEGHVKLADFGLSRHLYKKHYYRVTGAAVLPIRWMAPESFYGRFSIQSDVYSFGVTVWEIITLCRQTPFDDLTDNELIQITIRAMNANADTARPQPSLPIYCTSDVEQLLRGCWRQDPAERPNFSQLNSDLQKIMQS